eukprot:CAMPEP_0180635880 /NCGR_PEP_ID=MMETSP1037_2-20121125/42874_1 /TAXON_ID=632150 /ORGANISM="Azadinium spinosum, Strain 3D9" /LENGTH=99 /DNA_ID=CAMNT_0022657065 /DNA_START=229 /DNA_END=528 /DNA_ORIENTATION=-
MTHKRHGPDLYVGADCDTHASCAEGLQLGAVSLVHLSFWKPSTSLACFEVRLVILHDYNERFLVDFEIRRGCTRVLEWHCKVLHRRADASDEWHVEDVT